MKVDTMRKVDYFVGVPLCFAGTIMKKVFALFVKPKTDSLPRNILLIELSEMGSTILADPAMQKLKRVLQANIFFAIFKKNRPSLELLGTVPQENIYTIDDNSFVALVADATRLLFWTRRKSIDTVIDLELFSRFSALLTGYSGAQRTVGFYAFLNEGLYCGDFLTHKVSYNPHQHMSKNFIALANALIEEKAEIPLSKTFISDDETRLRKVAIGEPAQESIRQKIKEVFPAYEAGRHRIVLFNANASDLLPIRRWPREHYVSLAGIILHRYPETVILLTGGKEDRAWLEAISSAVRNERCINFAGQTRLSELPALYSVSVFMLSNDSGPPHFASVTDMPMFVFFGPETPKLYCPLGKATPIFADLACSPCVSAANHRKTVCNNNVCLQSITPERVFGIVRPMLDEVKIN
ncbi:MAG TPA: glycosyltransferase family 9 protein [Nitrospirota bacterium]|nr:glycosyltransferase family 9 protein [Nitrospirota bacterium]